VAKSIKMENDTVNSVVRCLYKSKTSLLKYKTMLFIQW